MFAGTDQANYLDVMIPLALHKVSGWFHAAPHTTRDCASFEN